MLAITHMEIVGWCAMTYEYYKSILSTFSQVYLNFNVTLKSSVKKVKTMDWCYMGSELEASGR